jgi:hypothetical protein
VRKKVDAPCLALVGRHRRLCVTPRYCLDSRFTPWNVNMSTGIRINYKVYKLCSKILQDHSVPASDNEVENSAITGSLPPNIVLIARGYDPPARQCTPKHHAMPHILSTRFGLLFLLALALRLRC